MKLFILFALIPFISFSKTFESGQKKVNLVELYTSQSCSSCPPVERWVSKFKKSSDLWKNIVPVSFHVTYWNHLSWVDKFSQPKFTNRQRLYNSKIQAGVYTPQVILNGKDFRQWRSYPKIKSKENPGNLKLEVKKSKAYLSLDSKAKGKFVCFVAILDNGYITHVLDGENEGRTLKENFIVQNFYEKTIKNSTGRINCELSIKVEKGLKKPAIAAWIARESDYKTIQAVGGFL